MSEGEKERIDRELTELMEELRIAIPGAQVLFAFLLGVAFTQRFQSATSLQRNAYFATLLLTAAATALLIAPAAYHRLRFRDGDKEHLLFLATRMAIGSLVLLVFAVSGVVFLVADVLYSLTAAGLAVALTAAMVRLVLVRIAPPPRASPGCSARGDSSRQLTLVSL